MKTITSKNLLLKRQSQSHLIAFIHFNLAKHFIFNFLALFNSYSRTTRAIAGFYTHTHNIFTLISVFRNAYNFHWMARSVNESLQIFLNIVKNSSFDFIEILSPSSTLMYYFFTYIFIINDFKILKPIYALWIEFNKLLNHFLVNQ